MCGVIIIPTTRGFATRGSNCHVPSHPSKGITAMSKIGHDSWKSKLLKNSRMRILMEKKLVNKNGQISIAHVKGNMSSIYFSDK